jgi:hypothetical protein
LWFHPFSALEGIRKMERNIIGRDGLTSAAITLIESPGNGINSLLDDESRLQDSMNDHRFTIAIHKAHNAVYGTLPKEVLVNPISATPTASIFEKSQLIRYQKYQKYREAEAFAVRHFSGSYTVCYETKHFVDDNNTSWESLGLETLLAVEAPPAADQVAMQRMMSALARASLNDGKAVSPVGGPGITPPVSLAPKKSKSSTSIVAHLKHRVAEIVSLCQTTVSALHPRIFDRLPCSM